MQIFPFSSSPSATRFAGLALAGLLAGASLAACGSSSSTASTPASTPASTSGAAAATTTGAGAHAMTVTIKNFAFSPANFTVAPGAQITVINKDSVAHTFTAMPNSSPQGTFTTGDLGANQTKVVTAPTAPGKYQYYCMIHNYMTGSLTVS